MEATQVVALPKHIRLPATLVAWKVAEGDEVTKGQELLIYEHVSVDAAGNGKKARASLPSPYAGKVITLSMKPNSIIDAVGRTLLQITEPCGHAVQYNGICTLCFKDLTIPDFEGAETSRATINMTYDTKGVLISQTEAARLDRETADRLLDQRRLSLILDLDKTVIHATVDPTVGEWMDNAGKLNCPVLEDLHRFVLPDSPIVYYIKLRPGTKEFLQAASRLFELHIYTMGTRTYAHAVAAALDPDGSLFKDHILSRDDSGSFFKKNIMRLFPCDQSMVVVIDDRGDVWEWVPNLIRIRPYDYFIGIGDINEPIYSAAQALKKLDKTPPSVTLVDSTQAIEAEIPSTHAQAAQEEEKSRQSTVETHKNGGVEVRESDLMALEAAVEAEGGGESNGTAHQKVLDQMDAIQRHSLNEQHTERPLARRLSVEREQAPPPPGSTSITQDSPAKRPILPVLPDNDTDLVRIGELLQEMHTRFYELRDAEELSAALHRRTEDPAADVRLIMVDMKTSVLRGTCILFSGVLDLKRNPERQEPWIVAEQFGARCETTLTSSVTHVVATRVTDKVRAARKLKNVYIVTINWLFESSFRWSRMPEADFLLNPSLDNVEAGPATSETPLEVDIEEVDNGNIAMELAAKLGEDDWKAMDDEVDEVLNESDGDEDGDDVGEPLGTSVGARKASNGDHEHDDFEDLGVELEAELNEVFEELETDKRLASPPSLFEIVKRESHGTDYEDQVRKRVRF